jgi:hypothetical protein
MSVAKLVTTSSITGSTLWTTEPSASEAKPHHE